MLSEAEQLQDLQLALLEHILDGLVAHLQGGLVVELDRRQLLTNMVDAGLHIDQHLSHALELRTIPLELLSRLGQAGLVLVDGLAAVRGAAELELLDLQTDLALLLGQFVDGRQVLLGEFVEVFLRVLLREELLDDFVDVVDAGRLLDVIEGELVVLHLLPLLAGVVAGDAGVQIRGATEVSRRHLGRLFSVLLLLEFLLVVLQFFVHRDSLLDECLLLLDLAITLVPLLHDTLLKTMELRLCHFLGVVRVVG
mmetsp:Transcript_85389/g.217647  ORF Transcript_85389/g.217647 Transcript_85389/m.217647 type:complete len:253 (+) Transcript_85389:442-1200(+)